MRSGELDKRITLQQQTKTPDSLSTFTTTWVDVATVWAAIWPVSAAEQLRAQQQVMTATHRVRIRYRSVLKPSWRVKFGDRYFAIVSIINPNEANKRLELLCKEAA